MLCRIFAELGFLQVMLMRSVMDVEKNSCYEVMLVRVELGIVRLVRGVRNMVENSVKKRGVLFFELSF